MSIDLSMNDVANALHVTLGALGVFIPVLKHWPHGQLIGSVAMIVFGIVKEFWFDLKYEDEQTSGGIKGGWIDLAGYVGGVVAANIILWL